MQQGRNHKILLGETNPMHYLLPLTVKGILKPSSSSHLKPSMRPHIRLLKCFVLERSVFKTKHLRSFITGFECLDELGFSIPFAVKGSR